MALFKKFDRTSFTNFSQTKGSVQRQTRKQILEQLPIAGEIDDIIPNPKVTPLVCAKCTGRTTMILVDSVPLFFQSFDGPWCPTLRLLHSYPHLLPKMQVDIGGCKYVLQGANVMCPGLTSKGGSMEDVEKGKVVGLYVEGKEHAVGVGIMLMSTKEIREENKGHGVENYHHMGDGLWKMLKVEI